MKTLYAACLRRLGLSLAEAAELHNVRLDTVKSWTSGRNPPSPSIYEELRELETKIIDASEALRETGIDGASIEINDSAACHISLMASADFVLSANSSSLRQRRQQ